MFRLYVSGFCARVNVTPDLWDRGEVVDNFRPISSTTESRYEILGYVAIAQVNSDSPTNSNIT